MSHAKIAKILQSQFRDIYHREAEFYVFSPGRINLIGEHTDYNGGPVLPLAINLGITAAVAPNQTSGKIRLFSMTLHEIFEVTLNQEISGQIFYARGFGAYLQGVTNFLQKNGRHLIGADITIFSDLPMGAGLSSSASLSICLLRALIHVNHISLEATEMAKTAQAIENEALGVKCGIMDPLIISLGQMNHALYYHCGSQDIEQVALPSNLKFIVIDTKTRRRLSDSNYNRRHDECKEAARYFGVQHLADLVSLPKPTTNPTDEELIYFKRARHVFNETRRVHQVKEALSKFDLAGVGNLINQSHESLALDFEVSSPALNYVVKLAQSQEGCLGARLMGAGFAGCALALTTDLHAERLIVSIQDIDKSREKMKPILHLVEAQDGARVI